MATANRIEHLTEEELATWRSFLVASRLLFDELDRSLTEEVGMSLADYGLLARLEEAGDQGFRMSDLADHAVFSRSRLSHAVDRLEKEGWVERRSCPTDRRGSYAALTDAGRAKLSEARPLHHEGIRAHLLAGLSPEQQRDLYEATEQIRIYFGAPAASC
jgi:DNA-binding MarR family transcriptional regulator